MMQEPNIVVLLGLPFHDLTMEETLDECASMLLEEECRYIVTANVDFTLQAQQDPDLKKIVYYADRILCDGMPLVWISRWFGRSLRQRVAGSDLVPKLLAHCAKAGHGVYFFGSDLSTLAQAKEIAERRYPGLRVAGYDAPPVGAVVEWNNDEICARMKASGARLLLVCLGCPKQERWIFAHEGQHGIPLSIGVGASLDFITGKQTRAPRLFQRLGIEWVWRMLSDPRRLTKRYAGDFSFFFRGVVRHWRRQRRKSPPFVPPKGAAPEVEGAIYLRWPREGTGSPEERFPFPETLDRSVVLDLSSAFHLDSVEMGRLAMLVRACRFSGKSLILLSPSRYIRDCSGWSGIAGLAEIAESLEQAKELLAHERGEADRATFENPGEVWLAFNYSLDALHLEKMTAALMAAENQAQCLVVDLDEVDFLDSRAVGALLQSSKRMRSKGGTFYLANPRPAVREIMKLLKLDKVLPEMEIKA